MILGTPVNLPMSLRPENAESTKSRNQALSSGEGQSWTCRPPADWCSSLDEILCAEEVYNDRCANFVTKTPKRTVLAHRDRQTNKKLRLVVDVFQVTPRHRSQNSWHWRHTRISITVCAVCISSNIVTHNDDVVVSISSTFLPQFVKKILD